MVDAGTIAPAVDRFTEPIPYSHMITLARVGEQTDILGESPLWDEIAQALWWVDIRRAAAATSTRSTMRPGGSIRGRCRTS